MTANVATASNEMNTMVNDIMVAQWAGVLIQWQGKTDDKAPEPTAKWIRVYIKHASGSQASLASDTGKRKWSRTGVIIVQCFVPLNNGGLDVARAIAASLQNGFQGKSSPSCVWFRNATVTEVGRDNSWYQVNFSALFTYDDVQ
jgi:hypothetical protein